MTSEEIVEKLDELLYRDRCGAHIYPELKEFVLKLVTDEREACAKIADEVEKSDIHHEHIYPQAAAKLIAERIRAR